MSRTLSVLCAAFVACASSVFLGASSQSQAAEPTVANAFSSATWRVTFTWNNAGTGTAYFTFYGDGTFKTSDGNSGRFFQIDKRAVISFAGSGSLPPWSCVYAITVADNGMSFSGIQGWAHTSGNPQKGTNTGVRTRFAENPVEMSKLLEEGDRSVRTTGPVAK